VAQTLMRNKAYGRADGGGERKGGYFLCGTLGGEKWGSNKSRRGERVGAKGNTCFAKGGRKTMIDARSVEAGSLPAER